MRKKSGMKWFPKWETINLVMVRKIRMVILRKTESRRFNYNNNFQVLRIMAHMENDVCGGANGLFKDKDWVFCDC